MNKAELLIYIFKNKEDFRSEYDDMSALYLFINKYK